MTPSDRIRLFVRQYLCVSQNVFDSERHLKATNTQKLERQIRWKTVY